MTTSNEHTYRSRDVVAFYARASTLQAPEVAILNRIKSRLYYRECSTSGLAADG